MALGRIEFATESRPSAGHCMSLHSHPFYQQLDRLLGGAGFDSAVENECRPFYAQERGRPSIPPSTVLRMWLVGRIEDIQSQRGLAWRCADSLTLREFIGIGARDPCPDHSTLSVLKSRIPEWVRAALLDKALQLARDNGLSRPRYLKQYSYDSDPQLTGG
jgi:transposase-like protein DUF772